MCIISGPVVSVGSTKILAIPSTDRGRQLTVYSNAVNTPADNLMCLPVPDPETVEFETVPVDIFAQCAASFDHVMFRSTDMTLGIPDSITREARPELEIRSHGSYEVVLIPSVGDLDRVPARFAILTDDVQDFIRRTYGGRGFGFLLCRLNPGAVNYEPFAYSHAMEGASLFLPTMHFHTHDTPSWDHHDLGAFESAFQEMVAARDSMAQVSSKPTKWRSPWTAGDVDWDHEIYTMCTPMVAHRARSKVPKARNRVNWAAMPERFRHGEGIQMHLREIAGTEESNRDLVFPIKAY